MQLVNLSDFIYKDFTTTKKATIEHDIDTFYLCIYI